MVHWINILGILFVPLAFLLEYFGGGIKYRFHPLNLMASVSRFIEKFFYKISNGIVSGIFFNLLSISIVSIIFSAIFIILLALLSPLAAVLFSLFILTSFLSLGGLKSEGKKIYSSLKKENLDSARENLLSLAGRDRGKLGVPEVSRAVIESIAENAGDGIGSVIFYFTAGLIEGLVLFHVIHQKYLFENPVVAAIFSATSGAVSYKMVNLLDSLTGHRNERYEKFGKFSAKFDDSMNYLPFRITAYFMLLSVFILNLFSGFKNKKYNFKESLLSYKRFKWAHPSPNAAQLESIMAGALMTRLGGVNYYEDKKSERPVIGFENYADAGPRGISSALKIIFSASVLMAIFYGIICGVSLMILN